MDSSTNPASVLGSIDNEEYDQSAYSLFMKDSVLIAYVNHILLRDGVRKSVLVRVGLCAMPAVWFSSV